MNRERSYKINIYKIYVHINKINGKLYIGQTGRRRMKDRYGKNGIQYKKCPYFYNAIQKYGWENFDHIVLIDNLSKEMANIIESELIKKYKTNNILYGYNLSLGGEGMRFARVKQYSKFGEYIRTFDSIIDAAHSLNIDESIVRASCGKKGAFLVDKKYRWVYECDNIVSIDKLHTRDKEVNQYNLNGEFLKTWISAKEIEEKLNFDHSKIAACCREKQKTAYGYIWRYHLGYTSNLSLSNDYFCISTENYGKVHKIPIVQMDLDGNFIQIWDSATTAMQVLFNKTDTSGLVKCCHHQITTAYGYKWMYYTDYQSDLSA